MPVGKKDAKKIFEEDYQGRQVLLKGGFQGTVVDWSEYGLDSIMLQVKIDGIFQNPTGTNRFVGLCIVVLYAFDYPILLSSLCPI